jgi:phage tail sheath gpL-like
LSINFNEIPVNLLTPGVYTEVDNSRAISGPVAISHVILIIGQQLAAGSATEGDLDLIFSADQADTLYGIGSQLARMIRAAKNANPWTEMWAIPLDDAGAGVAATKTVTLTGAATEDGALHLLVGGIKVDVAVSDGDSVTTIGDAIDTAVAANSRLSMTSNNVAGVVTFTAKNKGTIGQDIDISHNFYVGETTPAGITVAIADAVSGATDPTVSTAITTMGDNRFDYVIMPYTDTTNIAAMETEMSRRWGPLVQKYSWCANVKKGTQSDLTTYGNSRNSQFVSTIGNYKSPTTSEEFAAIYGSIIGFYANIAPARPFQTLSLPGVIPPKEEDRFTQSQRNIILSDGIATYVSVGGVVLVERAVTTYQLNAASAPDPSFRDSNTIFTLAQYREQVVIRITNRYPRHSLADDTEEVSPGSFVVRPKDIKSELISLHQELAALNWVEGIDQFVDEIVVVRNGSDVNRVDVQLPPDLVNQLRTTAVQVQYRL